MMPLWFPNITLVDFHVLTYQKLEGYKFVSHINKNVLDEVLFERVFYSFNCYVTVKFNAKVWLAKTIFDVFIYKISYNQLEMSLEPIENSLKLFTLTGSLS